MAAIGKVLILRSFSPFCSQIVLITRYNGRSAVLDRTKDHAGKIRLMADGRAQEKLPLRGNSGYAFAQL